MAKTNDSPALLIRPEIRLRPVVDLVIDPRADLALYQLKLMAAHLQLVTGFEELLCLAAISFQPFDYQIRAARTALRRLRGRGLLADEVGLGKTIEAGLVLKEYLVRQMVSRVLILTPPGLVEQWQEELAVKFDLTDFITSNSPEFRSLGAGAWQHYPRVIASLAAARRAEHANAITAKEYDLVIVDEAHHLKNRTSASWQLVNALQKKYILLLTATPVQNRLTELHNLVTVLKPGQLKSPKEFSQQFVARGDPRLPRNRALLRDLLADVMVRHTRSQISLKLPPRPHHPPQTASRRTGALRWHHHPDPPDDRRSDHRRAPLWGDDPTARGGQQRGRDHFYPALAGLPCLPGAAPRRAAEPGCPGRKHTGRSQNRRPAQAADRAARQQPRGQGHHLHAVPRHAGDIGRTPAQRRSAVRGLPRRAERRAEGCGDS